MTPTLRQFWRRTAAAAIVFAAGWIHAGNPRTLVALTADQVPDWPEGAVADRTIVSPLEFPTADQAAIARAEARAATRVSAIFRYEPAVAEAAGRELERTFIVTRASFQRAAGEQLGARTAGGRPASPAAVAAFLQEWRAGWRGMPVAEATLRSWLEGREGREGLHPLREALRQVLTEFRIREDNLDVEALTGPAEVRVVALVLPGEMLTGEAVASRARRVRRSDFVTVDRARSAVLARLRGVDRPLAAFAADLVRPNVFFERGLTRAEREEMVRAARVPPRLIRPGEAVVRAGERIGPAQLTALGDLRRALRADGVAAAQSSRHIAAELRPYADRAETPAGPSPWMQWVFLFLAPLAIGTLAIVIAVAFSRTAAVAARQDRRLTAVEERVDRLQPELRGRLRELEERIAELERQLAAGTGEPPSRLEEMLRTVRRQHQSELARLARTQRN